MGLGLRATQVLEIAGILFFCAIIPAESVYRKTHRETIGHISVDNKELRVERKPRAFGFARPSYSLYDGGNVLGRFGRNMPVRVGGYLLDLSDADGRYVVVSPVGRVQTQKVRRVSGRDLR
jgi:hypothetical protein